MAVFTDAQLSFVVDEIEKQNKTLYKFVAKYATNTWAKLQAIAKTGHASEYFEIGDEFICNYRYGNATYDWIWCFADSRNVELENGSIVPGIVLQSKYSTIESIKFDSPEQVEATEETAQEGVFYYGLTGSTVQASSLTLLDISTGDSIPYASYDKVFKSSVRDTSKNICQNGYNRYLYSAVRKWLNSSAAVGEDWFGELDHVGQVKPDNALTLAGFMHGLDEDFLAVVNPTKIQVVTNMVTDGGVTDIMFDKFWLPSVEEVYGEPRVYGVEGSYFPYWKNRTGLDRPSNSANDERKISDIVSKTGNAKAYWLRGCADNYSSLSNDVSGYGGVQGTAANNPYKLAPCCVIC